VLVYRGHTATMRGLGTVSVYCSHTAMVHTVWARCPCPDNMYSRRVATVSIPSEHGVRVLWPHGDSRHGVGTVLVYCGHTPTIHVVWARYLCTVATRRRDTPCGYGVRIPWPHGDRRHRVGTVLVYRVATVSVPRQYVRSPCGHGIYTE